MFIATSDNTGITINDQTYNVTVGSAGSGDSGSKFYFNGEYLPKLLLDVGSTYTFIQTNQTNLWFPNTTGSTLNTHPLMFSELQESFAKANGTHYTLNAKYFLDEEEVTRADYVANFATAETRKITLYVTSDTPLVLYYWAEGESSLGNEFNVNVTTLGAEPSSTAGWAVLVPGEKWRGGWTADVEYAVGDLVSFSSSTYRCITAHRSLVNENFPLNGNGYDFWTLYLSGDDSNALANPGDLLSFGQRSDGSTLGTIGVAVGTERQALTVESGATTLGYVEHGQVQNFCTFRLAVLTKLAEV